MLTKKLLDLAAKTLPTCRTLSDAEHVLGGEWCQETFKRDVKEVAVTWGLFDGWVGRPKSTSLPAGASQSDYDEAWEAGAKLARERTA